MSRVELDNVDLVGVDSNRRTAAVIVFFKNRSPEVDLATSTSIGTGTELSQYLLMYQQEKVSTQAFQFYRQ